MSLGRPIFAAAMTICVLAALQLEERDLAAAFGDASRARADQKRVSMILPWAPKRRA